MTLGNSGFGTGGAGAIASDAEALRANAFVARIGIKGGPEVAHEILKGRSVLLVEDSWLIAQGYKTVLEMSGVIVIGPAASIEDSQDLLLAHVPDIALVDINLDGEQTYELIESLLARKIPVVVISGNTVTPSVAARVDLVLSKPVGGAALIGALCRVAAQRRS